MTLTIRTITLAVLLGISFASGAGTLEGTGIATIHGGDLDAARAEAREAAIRDVALQQDVRVSSEETVLNGRITDSQLTVSSRAQISHVEVVDERRVGNALRVTVRAQVSDRENSCQAGNASGLKKRVAVTGFTLQQPEQARLGGLDDAGQMLPQWLQSGLQAQGNLQVLKASGTQLYPDVMNAPTSQQFDNRLTNVINVSRELGAQFVVAGVIRDIGVEDPSAWNTSVLHSIGRGLGATNTERRFIADMMIFDGFSGSPVYQKRFQTRGRWDAGKGQSSGFASAGFLETPYGQAVADLVTQMRNDIQGALACQPFMTRITRVEGTKVTLASGATAGLRPGDTLALYRSYSHFDSPDATPELLEADIEVTLDNVFPEYANGVIPQYGALENIQRGDIAIIW
ncbi:flagellar assembly protein T N-terminal domain-containing protein [Marinobacter sp. M1N3S26]|uniref:flagellar assembly protein T N-terminal domain-containing protein n=1 Tax=unclassified Marinobacter TaxID=83889 RepID=UPI00387B34A6